jgi:Ulp1 family protease
MYTIKNKDCKLFTCMVQGVFITHKPCYFDGVEWPESHFFLIALIKDKYLLQNIK